MTSNSSVDGNINVIPLLIRSGAASAMYYVPQLGSPTPNHPAVGRVGDPAARVNVAYNSGGEPATAINIAYHDDNTTHTLQYDYIRSVILPPQTV